MRLRKKINRKWICICSFLYLSAYLIYYLKVAGPKLLPQLEVIRQSLGGFVPIPLPESQLNKYVCQAQNVTTGSATVYVDYSFLRFTRFLSISMLRLQTWDLYSKNQELGRLKEPPWTPVKNKNIQVFVIAHSHLDPGWLILISGVRTTSQI